jgi:hypothetical protein
MKTLFAALLGLSLSALAMPTLAADEAECKSILEKIDVNKDGSVDGAEGEPFMAKATPETVKFDTDTDGKLSTTEFMDACKADTAGLFVIP